jgi:hypothetical protein
LGGKLLSLVLGLALPASQAIAQATTDTDVARGIRQIEDGDIDSGIVTLDIASRRLVGDPAKVRDLTQAYLYLGIGYIAKGQEDLAKARFRAAVAQSRDMTLSRDQYPPKVIELFEAAKREQLAAPVASSPSPSPSASAPTQGRSKTPLILAGVAVAGGAGIVASRGGGGGPAGGSTMSANYRLDPTETQTLALRGGGIGGIALNCQDGQVVTGFIGAFDNNVVFGLSPLCSVLLPDGALTGEFVAGTAGTVSAATPFTDRCPPGQIVVQISGFEGRAPINVQAIQQMSFACARVPEWVTSGTLGGAFGPYGTNPNPTSRFSDPCPMGFGLTSIASGTGSAPPPNQGTRILEKLQMTCTRIRR